MIGEAHYRRGGDYRIENDADRAAAMLAFLKLAASYGSYTRIGELKKEAARLVRMVESVTYVVRVNYTQDGAHKVADRELTYERNHPAPIAICDDACNHLLEELAEDGYEIDIQGSRILRQSG